MSSLARQTRLILGNDLRLTWREFRGGRLKSLGSAGVIGLLLVIAHAVTIVAFLGSDGPPLVVEAVAWWFFAFLMLGASINNAIGLLFERADFDLLLSSPLQPRAVLLARLLSMATSALLAVAIFLLPLINGAAIGVGPRYLCGYVAWIIVAVLTASTGVWLALGLVRTLGVRKARVVGQVVGAVFGASIYLMMQLPRFLSDEARATASAIFARVSAQPIFSVVARAARGEPLALGGLALLALCAAVLTTRLMARTFIAGTQEATVVATRKSTGVMRRHRWTEGLARATFRKDLRLILRDPLLLAQVLPSIFYVIPALLGFGRMGGIGLLAPIMVVIAAQFSMLLTAVAAAGEEGWDLIQMSPARTKPLRFAKMAAGMAPPLMLAALVGVVLALAGRPWLALSALCLGMIVAAGCAWLQVTDIRPTPRKDVMKRRGGRSFLRGLASSGMLIAGSLAMGLAANGLVWFSLIPGGLAVLGAAACFALVEVKEIYLPES